MHDKFVQKLQGLQKMNERPLCHMVSDSEWEDTLYEEKMRAKTKDRNWKKQRAVTLHHKHSVI